MEKPICGLWRFIEVVLKPMIDFLLRKLLADMLRRCEFLVAKFHLWAVLGAFRAGKSAAIPLSRMWKMILSIEGVSENEN